MVPLIDYFNIPVNGVILLKAIREVWNERFAPLVETEGWLPILIEVSDENHFALKPAPDGAC
jgi:hypothetical protein